MTPEEYKTLLDVSDKLDTLVSFKEDHEVRIRRLEWFRTWAAGVGSAITAFFTYLFANQH
jgi:hypothetical protein